MLVSTAVVKILQKEGVEVLTTDEQIRGEFFATGQGAWKDGIGELYSQEILDQVQAILREYRNSGH